LTAAFVTTGIAQIVRTNLTYDQILDLSTVTMPWGEQVAYLEVTDSVWSLLFLAAQLAALGFMIFACLRQYRRGQRSEALVLSIGVLWFVASITAEILGEFSILPPIFYGEFGFLGFALALSLQMSNEIIKTEEELAAHRLNLEELVSRRTADLEQAQQELVQQAQQTATTEERSRLARDLHDAVTQTIYSATLIAEALPQVWDRNPEEGRRNLAKLRQLVRGALAEMRTLLFE
jgi:signal transduction histidine kinase